MNAVEVLAERERRMRDDTDYRAKVERFDSELAERTRQAREAEQPILRDLAGIGIDVDSVWNLYKIPDAGPKAIPVLLSHLVRDYPDRVLDGIGSALSDKSARAHWTELKTLYTETDNAVVRDRLAAAMSACAIKAHYEDLLSFVRAEVFGETRIYFLRPINRIGNRISPGTGRDIIASLANNPVMGKEARAILAGRAPNE